MTFIGTGEIIRRVIAGRLPKKDVRADVLVSVGFILQRLGEERVTLVEGLEIGRFPDEEFDGTLFFVDLNKKAVFSAVVYKDAIEYSQFEAGEWVDQVAAYERGLTSEVIAQIEEQNGE
jgi:hypothetical protein